MRATFAKSVIKNIFYLCILVFSFFVVLKLISPIPTYVKKSQYYAVFLTNGQVYFGNIEKLDSEVLMLNNVYYLRANTNLQEVEQQTETNVELSLIKLGNELHGPKNSMTINRTNILFWEELRNDGKVIQAIRRDKT